MASFLSQPTQFNKFVAPTDLELTAQNIELQTKVGMEIQSKYDQNLQKIQGVTATIAGLQVAKEEDKAYLGEKVSKLREQLLPIVGGDLSQTSLLNQATSLAADVYNDQGVQNAVQSTMYYQDALSQIEKATQEGKAAASNTNMVMRNVNAWLTDGKAGSKLGKQVYTPYYNYQDPWIKFLKAKGVNTRNIQSAGPGPIGEDGKPIQGSMIAYALVEGKEEILSDLEVSNLFQQFLQTDAQAQTQVGIDATYYSDITPDDAALSALQATRQGKYDRIKAEMDNLLLDQQSQATSDPNIDRKLEMYNQALSRMYDEDAEMDRMFLENPAAAKMKQFQNQLVDNMGSTFSYSKLEQKYVTNPMRTAWQAEQTFLATQKQREFDNNLKQAEHNLRMKKLQQETSGTGPTSGFMTAPGGVDTESPESVAAADARIKAETEGVVQDKLRVVYEFTRGGGNEHLVTKGRDSNGNTIYTWNGKADFTDVWNRITDPDDPRAINKNLNTKAPSIRAYYADPSDATRGVGRERLNRIKSEKVQQIRDTTFGTIEQRVPRSSVSNLEAVNFQGVNITPQNVYDTVVQDAMNGVDVTTSKYREEVLSKLTQGSGAVAGRPLNAPTGNVDYSRVLSLIGDVQGKFEPIKEDIKQVTEDYRRTLIDVSPPTYITYTTTGGEKDYAKDVIGAITNYVNVRAASVGDKTSGKEDLVDVVSTKDSKTVSFNRNYDTGGYEVRIANTEGKEAVIQLDQRTAVSLNPQLATEQNVSTAAAELRIKGDGDGYAITDPYFIMTPNASSYRLKYQVAGSPGQYTLTLLVQKGDAPVKKVTLPNIFSTPEEAERGAKQISALDDAHLDQSFM